MSQNAKEVVDLTCEIVIRWREISEEVKPDKSCVYLTVANVSKYGKIMLALRYDKESDDWYLDDREGCVCMNGHVEYWLDGIDYGEYLRVKNETGGDT